MIIRKGFDSLEEPTELEEDLLDQAWGLEADSRLSCQAVVADEDLVVEIPKYHHQTTRAKIIKTRFNEKGRLKPCALWFQTVLFVTIPNYSI